MDSTEYKALGLPEATLTMHRDEDQGRTYVVVQWDEDVVEETDKHYRTATPCGFKFIVDNVYMDRLAAPTEEYVKMLKRAIGEKG